VLTVADSDVIPSTITYGGLIADEVNVNGQASVIAGDGALY
jgi:hypothetical protein